jgi:hypothetical protein
MIILTGASGGVGQEIINHLCVLGSIIQRLQITTRTVK